MFRRPIYRKLQQDQFGNREVGVTHPDNGLFIRLTDSGDIYIVRDDGCAIIMGGKKNKITIVADEVEFVTRDGDAIRWNGKRFNSNALDFTEPALVIDGDLSGPFDGVEDYYEEEI